MLLLAGLAACQTQAQTPPSAIQTYAMPAGKKAVLRLPHARNIVIKAWNKAELQFQTEVYTNRDELKNMHTQDVSDGEKTLRISTDYRQDCQNQWPCWTTECDSTAANKDLNRNFCVCYRVDYTIFMPARSTLHLETISGNIEVRGLEGSIYAKSISGFVDIDRATNAAASLRLHSITGEIYTDFDLSLETNSTAYSKTVRASIAGGGQELEAETISGNIFFRKKQ